MSLESLAAHRRLRDIAGEALCLNNVASTHLARLDYAAAAEYLREALALCDREGLVGVRAYVLANLTEVAIKTGDPAAADGYATRGVESATAVGNRPVVAWLKLQFARLALQRGDLAAARADLAESLTVSTALGQSALKAGGVMIFAEALAAHDAVPQARQVFAYLATHPSTSAPDRDEIHAHLARLPASPDLPWPALDLDALIDRIVGEAPLAYQPLLALLRAAR